MNITPRFITSPLRLGLLAGLFLSSVLAATAQAMNWTTVRVGGGGATTTVQAHPKVQNLFFITTDMGTPYRWNHTTQRWEGMFYKTSVTGWDNRHAAARLAFVPSDTTGNTLYATVGGPWSVDGTVLKSSNRGDTWTALPILIDVKPNKEQGAGQRIAVDPLNSNIVYVTTRSSATVTATNGTFKSTDAGASWTKINNLYGSFVEFDVSGGTLGGVTKNIYIGCSDGVHRSTDGGASFTLMPGSPTGVVKAALHSNGTMYVTAGNPWVTGGGVGPGVFKWNGSTWATITPPSAGAYAGVAVNPQNSLHVVVNSTTFVPNHGPFNHYRSNDGGATWTFIDRIHDKAENPWFDTSSGQASTSFCWDPFNASSVWFSDFFFAYQTTDIWTSPKVTWRSRAAGHEESVSIGTLLSPPSGSNLLLSSVADIGGWDHKSLTASPSIGMMTFFPWTFAKPGTGNMTGVAIQETNPNFIARVGRVGWDGAGYAGYSTNGGTSYTQWTSPTDAAGGRIAVSATSETMVWVTQQNGSYRSANRGVTWTAIPTLPVGIIIGGNNLFSAGPRYPLAADKVNGNKFYVYHNSRMYVSTDAGVTFAAGGALPYSWPQNNLTVDTTPGKEGEVWVGIITEGLHRSTNSGASFTKIPNVQSAEFMAIGKASPATPTVPAIYVFGTVNNIANSLFRSDDNGVTWTNLGVPQIGVNPNSMAADRQVYGRVFFGTTGNGTMVGSIAGDITLAASADAFVKDGVSASTNYGTDTGLTVKTDAVDWNRHTYLKFDLSNVSGPINAGRVRLCVQSAGATSSNVSIYASANTSWLENGITWSTKPATTGAALASVTIPGGIAAGTWFDWDVTTYLQQEKAAGRNTVTLVLQSSTPGSATGVTFNSRQASGNQPQLKVVASNLTLAASADAYVKDGVSASANYGADTALAVKLDAIDWNRQAYLKFDLSNVSGALSSGKVRLCIQDANTSSRAISVYASANTSWSESALTWNTKPATTGAALATVTIPGSSPAGTWFEWDVTAYLQQEKAAGRNTVTLVIQSPTAGSTTNVAFNSREAATNQPQLNLIQQ
ncbi:MAG: DNRLRE domain-containing protein [Rariglobus sp.]